MILIKILKKLKLLQIINFKKKISLQNSEIQIPVLGGLGYANLFLKNNWLSSLIVELDLPKDSTFIDVGANIGQTFLQLKTVSPNQNYIGFEPNAACIYYMKQLIQKNNFSNFTLFNIALNDTFSVLDFEYDSITDPRASINSSLRPNYFKHSDKVICTNYESLGLKNHISMIKIDVEGAELSVIKGLKSTLLSDAPIIICEVLDSHNEEVLEFTKKQALDLGRILKECDYKIIQLIQSMDSCKINSFKEIDEFVIRLWSKESYQLNDYIFCPKSRVEELEIVLTKISLKS